MEDLWKIHAAFYNNVYLINAIAWIDKYIISLFENLLCLLSSSSYITSPD